MTAESAQPGKASNVTRPFPVLWVGSGDETRSSPDCWGVDLGCQGDAEEDISLAAPLSPSTTVCMYHTVTYTLSFHHCMYVSHSNIHSLLPPLYVCITQ